MRTLATLIVLVGLGYIGTSVYFQFEHHRALAGESEELTGGDPRRGRMLIRQYGCNSCHNIPAFAGTVSHVGPPLNRFALRSYIAGVAENRPHNLEHFLIDPRAVAPRSAMPNLHVTDPDARDLAAYLYTLQ